MDVKLLTSLLMKVTYVTHHLNLKFSIETGLKLSKIHRVLQFQQLRWLQHYIAKNPFVRSAAKSELQKLFKLMSNSISGKPVRIGPSRLTSDS